MLWDYSDIIVALQPIIEHLDESDDLDSLRRVAYLTRFIIELAQSGYVSSQIEVAEDIRKKVRELPDKLDLDWKGEKIVRDVCSKLTEIIEKGNNLLSEDE